jgi:MOSC domain-containing protein YiiM
MRLLSVNLGVRRFGPFADARGTGIDKRPIDGRATVRTTGLGGDVVVHGGLDQAAYAYASEDARFWAKELDRDIGAGWFGENLTTEGLDITNALIGEQWTIGTATFEVSGPRIPCRIFAGFHEIPDMIKRFTAHGAPGAYLRVVAEGDVSAGDRVEVTFRPDHQVTLGQAFGALTIHPDLISHVVNAPQLAATQLEKLRKRLTG